MDEIFCFIHELSHYWLCKECREKLDIAEFQYSAFVANNIFSEYAKETSSPYLSKTGNFNPIEMFCNGEALFYTVEIISKIYRENTTMRFKYIMDTYAEEFMCMTKIAFQRYTSIPYRQVLISFQRLNTFMLDED